MLFKGKRKIGGDRNAKGRTAQDNKVESNRGDNCMAKVNV